MASTLLEMTTPTNIDQRVLDFAASLSPLTPRLQPYTEAGGKPGTSNSMSPSTVAASSSVG